MSNRYFIYVYRRGSAEPIWVNPVYQALRIRIDKALKGFQDRAEVCYSFDPPEDIYSEYDCYLDLLEGSQNQFIEDWAPKAIDSRVPFYING